MTAGLGNHEAAAAAGSGHLRASHADREHVIGMLKAAFVQGRLTKDEFDLRVGQTFASRTYAELAALTADIPAGLTAAPPPRRPARARPRPPMSTAAKSGICAGIALATLAVADYLTDGAALAIFVPFYFMALLAAGAQALDSRHQKRSRGQPPPRPAQRGQAVGGKPDGRPGDDLNLCEARKAARARHLTGRRAVTTATAGA